VGIGRARGKSEHEQCNVQKNHGYELTHNYGHGQQTVSMVFYFLNLLAFMAHMILERGDRLYQRCVATTARKELWHMLRASMRRLVVSSWSQMLLIYLDEDDQGPCELRSRPGPTGGAQGVNQKSRSQTGRARRDRSH
jgi:hypothetical protein